MKANVSIILTMVFLAVSTAPGNVWGREPARAIAPGVRGPMTVTLASGRTFTGALDQRTDNELLWIRFERSAARVLRPIYWDRVVRVLIGDEEVSAEELRAAVETVRNEDPALIEPGLPPRLPSPPPSRGRSTAEPINDNRSASPTRVGSLAIDATAANWDGDVENDGLLLRVYPLDREGAAAAAEGTLSVELIAERAGRAGGWQQRAAIGQWTRRVAAGDFGPNGATYRLPFQVVHPEFDADVAPHGVVHARLSVPGHGVFSTTETAVRIRPPSAARDRWQQVTGRRFHPRELTGRPRR
jgi:hypothetical protein